MKEEKPKQKIEEKMKEETKKGKVEEKMIEGTAEKKEKSEKKEKKTEGKGKKEKPEIKKKTRAIVRGKDLHISTKHSVAICRLVRGKKMEKAVAELEKVLKKEKPIKMKGEIPHRKGKGRERGRYPIKACKVFIKLLKSLAANSSVNGLEEPYIFVAKADQASRPYRRFGSKRFKRTHILLIAKDKKTGKKEIEEGKKAK